MSDASEDSELAAILDEGLFPDTELDGQEGGEAVPDNPVECSSDAVAAAAADEQPEEQTAKRARTHVAASNSNSTRGVAMRSKCPPHPGWYAGMCIACGAQRTAQDLDPATIAGDAKDDSASGATTRIRHLHHRPGQALEVCSWWQPCKQQLVQPKQPPPRNAQHAHTHTIAQLQAKRDITKDAQMHTHYTHRETNNAHRHTTTSCTPCTLLSFHCMSLWQTPIKAASGCCSCRYCLPSQSLNTGCRGWCTVCLLHRMPAPQHNPRG